MTAGPTSEPDASTRSARAPKAARAAAVMPRAAARPTPPLTAAPREKTIRSNALIGICADDVGLVPGVAETVAELAAQGRLSSASCVVNSSHWPNAAVVMRALVTGTDAPAFECGLHLNLTDGAPLSPDLARHWPVLPGLERLIVEAHLGRLPRAALAVEFKAQTEAFADAFGAQPAVVDGHQHVHHLPGIRDLALDAIATWRQRPAVRNTGHVLGPGHPVKRWLIEGTGGRALQEMLLARGIAHNTTLLGAYDFKAADYRVTMCGWLASAAAAAAAPSRSADETTPGSQVATASSGALLFCHPQRAETVTRRNGSTDVIADARTREAAYLGSAAFAEDLEAAGLEVGASWVMRRSSAG